MREENRRGEEEQKGAYVCQGQRKNEGTKDKRQMTSFDVGGKKTQQGGDLWRPIKTNSLIMTKKEGNVSTNTKKSCRASCYSAAICLETLDLEIRVDIA